MGSSDECGDHHTRKYCWRLWSSQYVVIMSAHECPSVCNLPGQPSHVTIFRVFITASKVSQGAHAEGGRTSEGEQPRSPAGDCGPSPNTSDDESSQTARCAPPLSGCQPQANLMGVSLVHDLINSYFSY